MICQNNGSIYDFIRATVTEEGIRLLYKHSELDVSSSDFISDSKAIGWSVIGIRVAVAACLGVLSGVNEIEVNYDMSFCF